MTLFLCPLFSFGQGNKSIGTPVKVYRSYSDYKNDIFLAARDTSLVNKTDNRPSERTVWGIQTNTGVYRVTNGDLYHIEDTSGLIIYNRDSVQSDVNAQTIWMPVSVSSSFPYGFPFTFYSFDEGQTQLYYFSKSLNSEIFPLTTENLVAQVPVPAFDKAVQKEFRWYNYKVYDKDKNGFLVNKLYRRYCRQSAR